jgi:AsmA protein
MKRAWKIVGAAVALLLLVAVAVPFLLDANQFRPLLQSALGAALGREVKVGNLKLSLLSGGLTADDLSVADDPVFSHSPFVQAKSLHIGVDLLTLLFSRRLTVTSLTIDQPQIWLIQSPSGDWNFSNMGTKSVDQPAKVPPTSRGRSNLDLSAKLVRITGGRFTVGRIGTHLKPLILEKVEVELRDFAANSVFPFSLSTTVAGGGSIRLDGKAGPINESDVALTPASVALKIDKLDLAGSGLNEIAPSVAGLVTFDGTGETSGASVQVKGRVKVEKLKLAANGNPARRILELDFQATHDLKKRSGTLMQADIHLGSAVARLTGTYMPQGDTLGVDMHLTGSKMPVAELVEMLPALAIVFPNGSTLQGGTASLQASLQGPVDRLVTTGSLSLNDTRLAGFNLSSRLTAVERLAGVKGGPDTEIQVLSSDVKVAPEGMSAENIQLVLPAVGSLSGAGTVSPASALSFRMLAAVHTGGVAAMLNNAPVPFTVEGTCAEPIFHPDLKAVMKGEVKGVGKTTGGFLKGLLNGKKRP